ncbi:MAG: potassium channel family protein [Jatrophihabitans sp.]
MSETIARVRLPHRRVRSPLAAIGLRFAAALAIVIVNWLIVLLELDGYTDGSDGHVSVIDALYYTTVTLSTTGYGDITPVTTSARIVNAVVVTPMRLAFIVLLVGTTINALTRQSRHELRHARWRKRVHDHTVVLGFGTKGRSAVRAMILKGTPAGQIVVVDTSTASVTAAADAGHVSIQGSGTSDDTLRRALCERAASVIIALDRDDSAILATLSVRRINPGANVIAAARESQNADLLRQSGADSVIVSSETAGRLLGLAGSSPASVAVLEDLVSFGTGLDIVQRAVRPDEIGSSARALGVPVLVVLRNGAALPYDHADAASLREGDELVYAGTGTR